MKTKDDIGQNGTNLVQLNRYELQSLNGGGFAYDVGFFLRECVVCLVNGSGVNGMSAVITDVTLNYDPAN